MATSGQMLPFEDSTKLPFERLLHSETCPKASLFFANGGARDNATWQTSWPIRLAHKTVADAGFSQDIFRTSWIILDLLPEMSHINTNVMTVFDMGWSPNGLQ